jgi:hypothetical protein
VRIHPDDVDLPAATGQTVNHRTHDGVHVGQAVSCHVEVTAESIDEPVGLDCVPAGDDEREGIANFHNVLQQPPVQVVEVHGVADSPSASSG